MNSRVLPALVAGEPACTPTDITKIRNTLGWAQAVSFEIGVAMMIKNHE